MDLSQQIYVQCINCHSNIFEPPQNQGQGIQGPICQHCLFYQSKLISQENQQLSVLQSELLTIKNQGSKQNESSKQSIELAEYNQKQINVLELQVQRLIDQENTLDNNQRQLQIKLQIMSEKYKQKKLIFEGKLQQYGDKVCQLTSLGKAEAEVLLQLRQLTRKKQRLLGHSVLMQIYHIHFDDEYAFINGQPVTINNLDSLLEIVSYLIKKYNYPHCQINSAQREITQSKQQTLILDKMHPQKVKKWLQSFLKQTLGLWQHIKQVCAQTTKQNYDCYVLPFKIAVEPQLAINGKILAADKGYASFLKYFTHNIKYMISFDFDVEMKSIERWQASQSYRLQSMDD